MNDTLPEPEVVEATLKEMKCPYSSSDSRATVWLEGYKAGYTTAADTAIQRLKGLSK